MSRHKSPKTISEFDKILQGDGATPTKTPQWLKPAAAAAASSYVQKPALGVPEKVGPSYNVECAYNCTLNTGHA
jgi:hypothetical protein